MFATFAGAVALVSSRKQLGSSQTRELGLVVRGDVLRWDGNVGDFRVVGCAPFRDNSRQTVGQRAVSRVKTFKINSETSSGFTV